MRGQIAGAHVCQDPGDIVPCQRGHIKLHRAVHDTVPRATEDHGEAIVVDVLRKAKGRVVCLGDAVPPVSPYAAYGIGMAIEDGYFLARYLGSDLSNVSEVDRAFAAYEKQRVAHVNHHVELARKLGNIFHHLPVPLAVLRDLIYGNTTFLQKNLTKDCLKTTEDFSMALMELHQPAA